MIGAGAVVTHDVPAHALVMGNPARIVDFVVPQRIESVEQSSVPELATIPVVGVPGVRLHRLPGFSTREAF